MVGSGGSSAARVSGIDRFYSPPAIRRKLELQKQKQQQQQQQQQKEVMPRIRPSVGATATAAEVKVVEDRFDRDDASLKPSVSTSSSPSPSPSPTPPPVSPTPVGNLDQLLESTTPIVPARYFSKVWKSSFFRYPGMAMGLGLFRCSAEGSDGNNYLDTSSEGSSGSEDNHIRETTSSLGATGHIGRGGYVNDKNDVCPKPTLPVFEYFEKDPPYGREPLADKSFVGLQFSYCHFEHSPWPLDSHLLDNTSPPSEVLDSCTNRNVKSCNDRPAKLCLPVFGLASYKFRGSIWTSSGLHEQQLASSLLQDADNWLRLLQVDHPDYRFFLSHSNTFRR
ncbi:hypothetical protein BHE74_00028244 [Ensete ventricosum]|nr:hypothetical protein BHE74_00028244 [Ensete ventricosum]